MSTKAGVLTAAIAAIVLSAAQPAAAQQTLNFTLGYFAVRGEDARVDHDVLVDNRNVRDFEISDFNAGSIGVEWLVPLGDYFEAGAGASFSRRTVPSVYTEFIDEDGTEIDQESRMRLMPVAVTVRVLPLGQTSPVQPYLGGGLAIVAWRYSEFGEFIDFQRNNAIFREQYVASGNATGPVILGGLRFAGDAMSGGFEVRYHSADAPLGDRFATLDPDLRIDVGGWTYQATVGVRF
jgi:opacity protein-like surface antigen